MTGMTSAGVQSGRGGTSDNDVYRGQKGTVHESEVRIYALNSMPTGV